jgi:hypothetical protein
MIDPKILPESPQDLHAVISPQTVSDPLNTNAEVQRFSQLTRSAQTGGKVPPGPLAGLTVHVKFIDGHGSGVRRADAIGSQIIVDAGPADAFAVLSKAADFNGKTVAYIVDWNEQSYIGRGTSDTRLAFQTGKYGAGSTFGARQIYVLHSRDARIAEKAARYIEARLIELGFALGARLTNKVAAVVPLVDSDHLVDFERMFEETLLLLAAAGCSIFRGTRIASSHDDNDAPLRDGYRIIAADGFTPPDGAQLLRLDRPAFICHGYRLGDHLIVRPGAHFKIKNRIGNQRDSNIRRRAALLAVGVLDNHSQRSDRKVTNAWIQFETPEMAARVLSGCHSTVTTWAPVDPAATSAGDLARESSDTSGLSLIQTRP